MESRSFERSQGSLEDGDKLLSSHYSVLLELDTALEHHRAPDAQAMQITVFLLFVHYLDSQEGGDK